MPPPHPAQYPDLVDLSISHMAMRTSTYRSASDDFILIFEKKLVFIISWIVVLVLVLVLVRVAHLLVLF